MKKTIIILIALAVVSAPLSSSAESIASRTSGQILLQAESNGEAWYVYPKNNQRYFLGRPTDAFKIMKQLALGVKHELIAKTEIFPNQFSGLILLDVEAQGEAYYIYPNNLKKYYLGRPNDAFRIMRELGLGITNSDLERIAINKTGEPSTGQKTLIKSLINGIPFTTQAPFGNWSDERQENACEEASALMAVKWAKGETLTKEEALKQILGASDYIAEEYGEFRDVSSQNTVDWIFKDYFNYDKVKLIKGINAQDIISELNKGNVVIIPADGVRLNNPHFKAPGPPRHMLLIRGYDPASDEFITNDPGTKYGELYRYKTQTIMAAIRDYPTGYHETIKNIEKNMIVVSK